MDRSVLVNEFEDMGLSISDDIIDECVIICLTHKISASDFVGSWIAQCASSQVDANDLNKENLMTLVKSLKVDNDSKANNKKCNDKKSDLNVDLSEAAKPQTINNSFSSETKNIKIGNYISVSEIIDAVETIKDENTLTSVGDVACNYGCENINKIDSSVDVDKISFFNQELWNHFVFGGNDVIRYEYHLDNIVNDIAISNDLKNVLQINKLDYGDTETEITIYGTLKLYQKELYLHSGYGDMSLDLSEAKQPLPDLFFNQILIVTGTTSPRAFKVKRMFTDASLPILKTLPTFSKGNLNLMVAAGPFFSELSPHGQSLKSIIKKTIETEAKLLILLGPIFESEFGTHLNKASTENFQLCIDNILEAILKPLFSNTNTQNTKVIVLSSWKDAGNYCFYPTPPNTDSRLPTLYPNNVFMVSDPCVFSVNGIIIAGNASDTLFGLHSSIISNNTRGDILEKLCKQIIFQRSLHPSYTINPTVPVDQLMWGDHCLLQKNTPHIILTSSQLRTFIKCVNDCVVVNVGSLVKHNAKREPKCGTYGKIQIAPPKDGVWSPQHNISAEIIHI